MSTLYSGFVSEDADGQKKYTLYDTLEGADNIGIIGGCTDPAATNYNPNATFNDGSCRYESEGVSGGRSGSGKTPGNFDFTKQSTLYIRFTSTPYSTEIVRNGKATGKYTSNSSAYQYQELLNWNIFTVQKKGYERPTQYRVRGAVLENRGPTPDGRSSFSGFAQLIYIIETINADGAWVPYTEILADAPIVNVTLDFKFNRVDLTPGDDFANDYELDKIIVDIKATLSEKNTIRYILSDGRSGFVKDIGDKENSDSTDLIIPKPENGQTPWIQFERVGINSSTHNISYTVFPPGKQKITVYSHDFRRELGNGRTVIEIEVNKLVTTPSISTPRVTSIGNSYEYNYETNELLAIPYETEGADRIVYSILDTRSANGTANGFIRLNRATFKRGLGQYTLYVQPISDERGSGEIKRVNINVVSKEYREGPDITKIDYPYNIKGSDFKGYDENFQISWQSVNTNFVALFVSKFDSQYSLMQLPPSGVQQLNVQTILKKAGIEFNDSTDKLSFDLLLVPYNSEGSSTIQGKVEKITIVFDKSDIKLKRAQVVYDIHLAFKAEFNPSIFASYSSKYLTHFAHFGSADNKLITTWATDSETFSEYVVDPNTNIRRKVKDEKALVLKLYEPLPTSIQPNQQIWISKAQSLSLFEQITLTDEAVDECVLLSPNFDIDLGDDVGYQIIEDLVASGSITSTELVNRFINENELSTAKLNIQFVSGSDVAWSNFTKYSSAKERIENFFYKVKTIEFYNNKLESLESASLATTGSISVKNEISRVTNTINGLESGFDAFEYFMYSESSSISFPGAGGTALSASDDSSVTTWYNTSINSAKNFDLTNKDALTNNIPAHFVKDANNDEYILFFNMIGQHFDVLWSYIKGVANSKKIMHTNQTGMIDDLVYHMLESLGWNADMGVRSQVLWEYAFGKNKDGTEVSTMSGKERQQEIWRRILNNLPYLYKHKGTKRAIHAAMACYGVPTSMLTIMEFGGPIDPVDSGTKQFTFDDRTAAVEFDGTGHITVPFTQYTGSGHVPKTIEVRINTEERQNHTILQSVSGSTFAVNIFAGTGSQAAFELQISSGSEFISASSGYMPFFNDEYTQIVVTEDLDVSGSNYVYKLYAKEGFNERIRNQASASITIPTGSTTGWSSIDTLKIGQGFVGTIDEFRLWNSALSESRVDNHTLLPDAIDGNFVSASTDDLLVRFDFEYPKNLADSGSYLPNVAINQLYGYQSASVAGGTIIGFTNNTTYPYQYVPYERTVTATVPNIGVGLSNKVRFETHTLNNYLNYGSVSDATNLERSDDSNRLGLFFSPIKEINMDILRSLGEFHIDNYIGNPADEYEDTYKSLDNLRNYYFQRYNLNIYEYIQLVRYIDRTLFTTLLSLTPARAKVSSGLLIEPHLLERSKVKKTKPIAENIGKETSINVDDDITLTTQRDNYEVDINTQNDVLIESDTTDISGIINEEELSTISANPAFYTSTIATEELTAVTGNNLTYVSEIDASVTGSAIGEFEADTLITAGFGPDSIATNGFGIYAENGRTIRTYLDVFGNMVRDRRKVFLIKEQRTVKIPQNIDQNDASLGTQLVDTTQFVYKVTFLLVTDADPVVGGNIVEVTPVNGYLPSHYSITGDLTTGLQTSWYGGSKQTARTTTDGGSPVQTFSTNPNTLRVTDTGRGSGEPILIVN